jgi:hypothetical protein
MPIRNITFNLDIHGLKIENSIEYKNLVSTIVQSIEKNIKEFKDPDRPYLDTDIDIQMITYLGDVTNDE